MTLVNTITVTAGIRFYTRPEDFAIVVASYEKNARSVVISVHTRLTAGGNVRRTKPHTRRQRPLPTYIDDDDDGNNNNNNNTSCQCVVPVHTHTVVFLRVNYTLVHGYLGGGNQGELVFGTRMSDADAVACMRFARRRSSRPRRCGVCIVNNIISAAAAAADIILLNYRACSQCVYKIKKLNHFTLWRTLFGGSAGGNCDRSGDF